MKKYFTVCAAISFGFLLEIGVVCAQGPGVDWEKTFGGAQSDSAHDIQQTSDGGFIIAGETRSFSLGGDNDAYLIKTNQFGVKSWEKNYGGTENDAAYSVRETADGGFIVAGETRYASATDTDVFLFKVSTFGVVEWSKSFGGAENDSARSVRQTQDGGFIVAGETRSFGAGETDVYLLKINSFGSLAWESHYGGALTESASAVAQTPDSGFILAGSAKIAQNNTDVALTKIKALGTGSPPGAFTGHLLPAYYLSKPSVDPEGDSVTYTYHWTSNNGDDITHGPKFDTSDILVESELFQVGLTWTIEVTPTDGSNDGPSAAERIKLTDQSGGPTAASIWMLY